LQAGLVAHAAAGRAGAGGHRTGRTATQHLHGRAHDALRAGRVTDIGKAAAGDADAQRARHRAADRADDFGDLRHGVRRRGAVFRHPGAIEIPEAFELLTVVDLGAAPIDGQEIGRQNRLRHKHSPTHTPHFL
jgi:hypothetical protein